MITMNWVPKQYKHMIEEVSCFCGNLEVLLKEGWYAAGYNETIWLFNLEHYDSGDYTEQEIRQDLHDWLDHVEPDVDGYHYNLGLKP